MATISCHRPSPGNVMSAHAIYPPTVVCSRSMQAGRDGSGVGGERCDQQFSTSTGVCVTHSVEKSLHGVGGLLQLQAYNIGQTTPAIRLHSRPLLVQWEKSSLAVVNGLIKNFDFIHQGALTSQSWSRSDRGVTSRSSITRDSRKSRQKMAKNMADFCENHKNHGKNTAKTRHEITGPKTIIQSIKVIM